MKVYGLTIGLLWGIGLSLLSLTLVALNAQVFIDASSWLLLLLIPGFTFVIAGIFTLLDSQKVFQGLMAALESYSRSDFSFRSPQRSGPPELLNFTTTFNQMGLKLESRFRNLVEQRNELEAVLRSMLEAVVVLDSRFLVKNVNPAARQLFQIPENGWQGKSFLELSHSFELAQKAEEAMELGQIKAEAKVIQGAKTLSLRFEAAVIRDIFNDIQGLVIVLNDITTIKSLEQIRRDFVANVSHELKTPITNILGYIETLQTMGLDNAERAQNFLNVISKHADRMNRIIEDLLILSRIEHGRPVGMEKASCPIPDILAAALNVCQPKLDQKEIELITYMEEVPAIPCYAPLLEQAVVNLLDNAIKYSPSGKTVEIHCKLVGDDVSVAIKDFGAGIPQKDQPRIFERFYRVEKTGRDAQGTGLGLSIVRHIMALHSGRIEVSSIETQGTTFTLYFPLLNPSES